MAVYYTAVLSGCTKSLVSGCWCPDAVLEVGDDINHLSVFKTMELRSEIKFEEQFRS